MNSLAVIIKNIHTCSGKVVHEDRKGWKNEEQTKWKVSVKVNREKEINLKA